MSKYDSTKQTLETALERLKSGNTIRVPASRKLSVRAVEDEAGLGDGSAYYYPDIISLIKKQIQKSKKRSNPNLKKMDEISKLREALSKEKRLKDKYRLKIKELKVELAQLAAIENKMAINEQINKSRIESLENELEFLKQNAK
ncbi:hypothetical protein [Aliikangiella sp. IMCC44359]|uniref:hypothetical protein n=1 Tax=Aliikangiella sp. IMCC44359 TaxID=3459125 RepID=UPI00403AD0A0